ncbi:MAG: phenylalanine--tRNA ligase subunit beta [Coriobacteriia bacterium]
MRVSLTWLKELVDITLPVEQLCERLDMTGTKVEAVHTRGEALEGVVVGEVLAKEPHPDADSLSYCSVDVGAGEPLRIVCGATNFEAGDKVSVACVGATLPGGLTIKRAKLRGIVSEGMMCSAAELGVDTDASGLLVLSAEAPVGAPFAEYHGLADRVLELEVTPNRSDCLSMVGMAREVAAVTGAAFRVPSSELHEHGPTASDQVSVRIECASLCPRYTARVIRGITVGPSPEWLAERIVAAGGRPVNNVVDVTNYVMYELGQPLHAFDLATIAHKGRMATLTVRLARANERLRTLDGQDRTLAADSLVIADDSGPVALAGVMGGEATEVGDTTVDVLLESACFGTASISRTSRRLGLISESSLRFERGVDPELAAHAAARAAALIAEVAGGQVAPGVVDAYPGQRPPLIVRLRSARANAMLGTSLTADEMAAFLRPLGVDVAQEGEDLQCRVPTFRPDLSREVDLVEEVARLHGLENIPSTRPGGRGRVGELTDAQRFRMQLGSVLRSSGLDEHVGYSFGDRADLDRMGWELAPDEVLVELVNPMSAEQAAMRWSLVPSLLRAVSHNQRRGVPEVHLYELGTVFITAEGRKQPKERLMAGGALTGSWTGRGWDEPGRALDFFDGKGVLEAVFGALHVGGWSVRASEYPWLQAGRTGDVVVGGDVVGWIGEISARTASAFEVAPHVVLFEISVSALHKAASRAQVTYAEIPRHPAYELDVAFVVDETVTAERLGTGIRSAGGSLLESVRLFDVYRDLSGAPDGSRKLPPGKKSMAFALTYRSSDRTLSDGDVRPAYEKMLRKVAGALGAEVRQ